MDWDKPQVLDPVRGTDAKDTVFIFCINEVKLKRSNTGKMDMIESKSGLSARDRMQRIFLFNESGDKWASRKRIIGGSHTNLLSLDDPKYPWAASIYRKIVSNTYNPAEFNLDRENRDFSALSDLDRKIFMRTLSSLMIVESVLFSNYEVILPYFTSPEVIAAYSGLSFQETLHADSYTQIAVHALPQNLREPIYESWRTTEWFKSRNRIINDYFFSYIREPIVENFLLNLIASAIVVGSILPTEFAVIYAFSRHNRLIFTTNLVKYINRDINLQYELLVKTVTTILEENPQLQNDTFNSISSDVIKELVRSETDFIHNVTEGMARGLTDFALTRFSQALANREAKALNIATLYPGISGSPIPWYDSLIEIKK